MNQGLSISILSTSTKVEKKIPLSKSPRERGCKSSESQSLNSIEMNHIET